ncbi:MAG: response regulator transcription factor [Roseivirga sp.]|nr:response regulator transcription factor [Roseivirga sp.]
MSEIRVFLVEDELLHAENTKLSIEEAGFLLAGECDHADKAFDEILSAKPDVVLMDISLPGKHNGITLAKALKAEVNLPVIFTTTFKDDETIKEAAATSPVSYLIKPVSTDNLKAAVTLALATKPLENITDDVKLEDDAVFIRSGNNLQKIQIADIVWIEAAGDNYCKLVTPNHQLVSRHTLKAMLAKLDSDAFVQTHRAYAVNRHKIESIHEKEQVIVMGEKEIPIGRTFKERLYEQLRRL